MPKKVIGKYGSFELIREGREIYASKDELELLVKTRKGLNFENIYGYVEFNEIDIQKTKFIISGVCLFDGRWKISTEAAKPHKNDGLSILSPASNLEREKLYKKLENGAKVIDIQYPTDISLKYHERLINWQLMVAKKAKFLEKMVVHIPRAEYHTYIDELENRVRINSYFNAKMKRIFGNMHDTVDEMSEKIWDMYQKDAKIQEKVEFISPFEKTNDPVLSYLDPYKNPQKYGLDIEYTIGVEDITEIRLSQDTGNRIPMVGAILSKEEPYFNPVDTDYIKIRVNEARY